MKLRITELTKQTSTQNHKFERPSKVNLHTIFSYSIDHISHFDEIA